VILSDITNHEKEQMVRRAVEGAVVKDWETGFLNFSKVNQQIDIRLNMYAADLIVERCQRLDLNAVLGIPYSGIPLATLIAERLDLPLMLSRKTTDRKIPGTWTRVFWPNAESFTVGGRNDFAINATCLEEKCRHVLLVDDVLGGGGTAVEFGKNLINEGLIPHVAVLVSKDFQGGFNKITQLLGENPICAVRIESLSKPSNENLGRINLSGAYFR